MAKSDPHPFHTSFATLMFCGFIALVVTGLGYSVATVAIVEHLEEQYRADRTGPPAATGPPVRLPSGCKAYRPGRRSPIVAR